MNSSVVVWLCGTAGNAGPAGTQTCPGTITGTITAANVIAGSITSQQLTAGDLADVIRAIRAGVAYANVHTSPSPGGEIRGQIRGADRSPSLVSGARRGGRPPISWRRAMLS